MASPEQIASFNSTWAPYSAQAGAALGVAPNIILAQWALESGYGTNTAAQGNNVGSISPGGKLATYGSPADFTNAYVSTISHNFPSAVGAGNDVGSFVSGLTSGTKGPYFTSDPDAYRAGIAQIATGTGQAASPTGATALTVQPAPDGSGGGAHAAGPAVPVLLAYAIAGVVALGLLWGGVRGLLTATEA